MGRDDTDVPCVDLDHLNLSRSSAWENNLFRAQAAEAEKVVCSLKHRHLLWRRGECIDVHAILESDHDLRAGEADTVDRGAELQSDDCFLLEVVPNDDLAQSERVYGKDTSMRII